MSDAARWRKEFADAQHTQLTDVRATAAKWASGITALLGIFATASVIIVPSKLGDLNTDWLKWVVILLAAVAGIAGLIAMWLTTLAAVGEPKSSPEADVKDFKRETFSLTKSAADTLKVSRFFTFLAVTALVLAAVASQADAFIPQPTAKVYVLVTSSNGPAFCGALKTAKDGSSSAGKKSIDAGSKVQVVKHC